METLKALVPIGSFGLMQILTYMYLMIWWLVGGAVVSGVWIQALAGNIVLCSWERHLTITVGLSTQVYK